MHILCLGLNHRTAAVSLRERLAYHEDSVKAALARLGCGANVGGAEGGAHGGSNGAANGAAIIGADIIGAGNGNGTNGNESLQITKISELVILSTCNRVEIYAVASEIDYRPLETFLSETRQVAVPEFSRHLYHLVDREAVDHLYRVAAGLDSLVLGEPQILGQVMNAFQLARSQGSAGPLLSRLFQGALHTGKRARSETAIGQNPASISSVAVHLAEREVASLPAAQVTVVGAGEMAELAVEALRKRGVTQILVVNRTLERASRLAERWNGQSATFEQLPEALAKADILITSTGAPHTVIHADMVAAAMQARPDRALVIIDIAVPRDVDIEAGQIAGVKLTDIDRLHERLEVSLARRAHQVPAVEMILQEETQAFMAYLESLDVLPLIAELRQQAEEIRLAELQKTLRRLPDLSAEERKRLDALTLALVKKILHAPITRLREEAGKPASAEVAATARTLFGLEG